MEDESDDEVDDTTSSMAPSEAWLGLDDRPRARARMSCGFSMNRARGVEAAAATREEAVGGGVCTRTKPSDWRESRDITRLSDL